MTVPFLFTHKASSDRFSLQSSNQWQFIGRKVQLFLTMDIPESTPIKCKIKLPFNGTAIMRITEVQFVAVRKHLTASISATTLISSANDDKNDIAWIDLGNVTYGSSENGTQIKIEFEVCHDSKNRNRFLMSVLVLATTSESHRVGLSHSTLCCLLLYNHTRLHWVGW